MAAPARQRSLKVRLGLSEFENTGQPIIVSAEGVLNNGQHRLLAVVEADGGSRPAARDV